MGVKDEHWCTVCKRPLDKAKDKYAEFELIHFPKKKKRLTFRKPKGLICLDCINKNPALAEAVSVLSRAGNPPFVPVVECLAWKNCPTYEPVVGKPIRCSHISVIGDKLYCKRSHYGTLELIQELVEVERRELEAVMKFYKRALPELEKRFGVSREQFEKVIANMWMPPSGVVRTEEHAKGEEKKTPLPPLTSGGESGG